MTTADGVTLNITACSDPMWWALWWTRDRLIETNTATLDALVADADQQRAAHDRFAALFRAPTVTKARSVRITQREDR